MVGLVLVLVGVEGDVPQFYQVLQILRYPEHLCNYFAILWRCWYGKVSGIINVRGVIKSQEKTPFLY
jgi:hypothetical protein